MNKKEFDRLYEKYSHKRDKIVKIIKVHNATLEKLWLDYRHWQDLINTLISEHFNDSNN